MPQWSPPLKGGSTRAGQLGGKLREAAAMEPAVERREHLRGGGLPDQGVVAAMEPAVERREHVPVDEPQAFIVQPAAMEPAVERREHWSRRSPAFRKRPCRNGARR